MSSKRGFKYLLLVFIFIGIIISLLGIYFYFFNKSDKQIVATSAQEPKKKEEIHTNPNPKRLVINGVKIDLPIIEGKIVNGVWETTQQGVSHLDISANPGEGGNIVLYGHNKKVLLGSLPYVSMGANIKVVTEDGREFSYKVFSKKSVPATDTSIALATKSEVLTIYTCDGPLDSTRFVLLAKPV